MEGDLRRQTPRTQAENFVPYNASLALELASSLSNQLRKRMLGFVVLPDCAIRRLPKREGFADILAPALEKVWHVWQSSQSPSPKTCYGEILIVMVS